MSVMRAFSGAMEIKDKITIVTGASAGIGLALARLLAQKGAPPGRPGEVIVSPCSSLPHEV